MHANNDFIVNYFLIKPTRLACRMIKNFLPKKEPGGPSLYSFFYERYKKGKRISKKKLKNKKLED